MKARVFSDDIKINKYRLEDECEHQASIYYYWAKQLADAKNTLNEKEDYLKLVSAQKELEIRKNWETEYQPTNGKQTEGGIKSVLESLLVSAKEAVRIAQADVNALYAAVSAMEHRKDELNNLRALLIGGFYAVPNGGGKREDANDMTQRDVRRKLNKDKE